MKTNEYKAAALKEKYNDSYIEIHKEWNSYKSVLKKTSNPNDSIHPDCLKTKKY